MYFRLTYGGPTYHMINWTKNDANLEYSSWNNRFLILFKLVEFYFYLNAHELV